jgi:hypothetical protein
MLPLAISLASTQLPSGNPAISEQPTGVVGTVFKPSCMPFNGVVNHAIDDRCGQPGGSSDKAKQAESSAKNNFCAAKDQTPENVAYQQLIELQTRSKDIDARHLQDRSPLQSLGEGKYVSYVAVIQEAHYSDVSKGEAVNCNIPGDSTNDIHIVLVQNIADDPCLSTTAEMSPHYRPGSWTPVNLMGLRPHPVRVQGQLFYDGSHAPCSGSSRPNPQRASLWEIHPVYSLEVCRLLDLEQCRSSSNPGDWVDLDKWVSSEE